MCVFLMRPLYFSAIILCDCDAKILIEESTRQFSPKFMAIAYILSLCCLSWLTTCTIYSTKFLELIFLQFPLNFVQLHNYRSDPYIRSRIKSLEMTRVGSRTKNEQYACIYLHMYYVSTSTNNKSL